ncbi:T9SS type A sorting domain-containing protein [bacterium]|nr:T9SS type A sorting domain-containing protein [bacterium]
MTEKVRLLTVIALLILISNISLAVNVTFQVNMNVQIMRGNFDPDVDDVVVRGNLNDWGHWGSGMDMPLNDGDHDGIYTGTYNDTGTGHREFKHVVLLGGDPDDIIDPFIQRSYEIVGGDPIVLPVVFFADDDGSGEALDVELLFQVDMEIQLLQDNFNPEEDLLVIRGSKVPLAWGTNTNVMIQDALNPNLWTLELQFDNILFGEDIQYKFVIVEHGISGGSPNDIWEQPDPENTRDGNRYYEPNGQEPDEDEDGYGEVVRDLVYFSDIDFTEVTEHDITVTFSVDTRPAYLKWLDPDSIIIDIQTGDPLIDPITGFQIAGTFNGWPWGEFTAEHEMYDDGTNGDVTAADSFFTIQHIFPAGSNFEHTYKYAVNGMDAEGRYGHDHMLTLSNAITDTSIIDTFGTVDHLYDMWIIMIYPDYNDIEERSGVVPDKFRVGQNYPNPFNPTTTISFDIPNAAPVELTVYNIPGQQVFQRNFGSLNAGSYSVLFNAGIFASGTYIYRLEAGEFSDVKKMMLLK